MAKKNMMQAFCYYRYGGGTAALKNVEIPIPKPKKNELLVKIEASSINPADWKIQEGMFRPILPFKFPYTPVTDISGEVIEIGPEVTAFSVGDKVVRKLNLLRGRGLAEYAIASEKEIVLRPDEVSPADAAGLPIAGLTAVQILKSIGTKFDGTGKTAKNILITAASGGVGSYAVQLAKLGGHHVTATCGARNVELVKGLGADEVLDYNTPEGESLKNSSGKPYDYIINCASGVSWLVLEPNLSANGVVMDIAPNLTNMLAFIWGIFTFQRKKLKIFVQTGNDELRFLVGLLREGKLKTVVNSKHPFGDAQEAWARSASGHATGKIIIEM